MSKWISVKDHTPKLGQTVIMFTNLGIYIGHWTSEFIISDEGLYVAKKVPRLKGSLLLCDVCHHWEEGGFVTHWMPLPEPPK